MCTILALLAIVGQVPQDVWFEAESATEHTFSGAAEFPGLVSGDQILRLWEDPAPGPDGYQARFPFDIREPATYHVWIAASLDGTSPFWWRVDEGDWQRMSAETDTDIGAAFGVSSAMRWVRLCDANLGAGAHAVTIKVDERRTILEHAYLLYLDAMLITARDVQPDGLVGPDDLPGLKAVDRTPVVPVPRSMPTGTPMWMGSSVGSARQNRTLVSLGFRLLQTDSDHLTVNEVEPGKWDWAGADAGLAAAQEAGAEWQYFPHFHWAPDWLAQTDRFVPSVGLNTGRRLRCMSLFSPHLPEWFDHCYAAMAEHYGSGSDKVAAIYLGIHGDFGEALYPLGFHPGERERFGEEGTGTGDYWCGDPYALAHFRESVRRRYGTIERLNAAWGTESASYEEVVCPPAPTATAEGMSPAQRRYWLDFVDWYHDSLTEFTGMVARAARKHFPESRLVLPVGNGDESLVGGCDLSALVKVCRESGVEMRSTHGGFQPVPQNLASMLRRLASASHFYGVPFWSEPPGGVTPQKEVGRIFESLSCRASGYWDWGGNPIGAKDVFVKYRQFLTQEQTVCDVALVFPTTDHRLRPAEGYPPALHALGTALRSVMDFDIVDERMIEDGALSGFRVLVFADGAFFAPEALARVEEWVRAGGIIVRADLPMLAIDGDDSTWQRLSGVTGREPAPEAEVAIVDTDLLPYTAQLAPVRGASGVSGLVPEARLLASAGDRPAIWARPLEKGWVIVCGVSAPDSPVFHSVVRDVVYHLPELDPTKAAATEAAPGAAWGSLYTVLLHSGEVIVYNEGDEPIKAAICGQDVEVAPHSLISMRSDGG